MAAIRRRELTVPDLVLLSLLAEQPMHGYQANLELERRQVQDWAGISRPQVYYSLEKLARQDAVSAELIKLRFFAGLSVEETSEVLKVSPGTVRRDWTLARAWLHRELSKQ